MGEPNPFLPLRERAFALAETGRFQDWMEVSAALIEEGEPVSLVRGLGADGMFRTLMRRRIENSRLRMN